MIILIVARAVPTRDLTDALRRWWSRASQAQRPWQDAMRRATETLRRALEPEGFQAPNPEDTQGQEIRMMRFIDDELTHVVRVDHGFPRDGRSRLGLAGHTIHVTGDLRLAGVERHATTALSSWPAWPPHDITGIVRVTVDIDDEPGLADAATRQLLPAFDVVPHVDALLDLWWQGRSVYPSMPGYGVGDTRYHAMVLASRGRAGEARDVAQWEFERIRPDQRPYLLELLNALGAGPLTTGTDPRLSLAEERVLGDWDTDLHHTIDRLRELIDGDRDPAAIRSAHLDGSRRSLDKLWLWLQRSPDYLRRALGNARPALPLEFYGRNWIYSTMMVEPWQRVMVELLAAYLGFAVASRAPGTRWGVAGDGELSLVRRGGATIISRIYTMVGQEFAAQGDVRRGSPLRQYAAKLVVRVNGSDRHRASFATLRTPD
jgi:hypothetical protein